MARQRLECSSCQAKFSPKTLCPRCGQPTTLASAQERILWEMGQWEDSRQRVVAQKPARILLTRSSPQVIERMARPDPRANGSSANGSAMNGSSGVAPIEQLDLGRNGSRAPEHRPQTAPIPQPAPPARPQPQQARPAVPQARSAPAPVRERPAPQQPTPERPPTPPERPQADRQAPERAARPPVPYRTAPPAGARTPVPRPAPRPVAPPQPEPEEQVTTLDTAPLEDVLRELAGEQQAVRTRPRPEIPFEPLPTSVGAATELREAVEAPSTARRRLSRKERRAKAKQVKETARRNAEEAKARAKAEEQARRTAAEQQKAAAKAAKKAGRKAGKKAAPVVQQVAVPAPPPPPSPSSAVETAIETEGTVNLSRREKRVEKLLDDIGAVAGEAATLVLDGRSRMRSATLVLTGYRVLLLTRGARRRIIGWIPLEEIERVNRVWRGAPTAHIEGSFERLSFQAGTTQKLEQAIELIRNEVREARAPGARRHHPEIIQLWCERTSEIWESDAGRLRLWVRRHPIFTLGWLGSLIPLAYFGAQRL